jgi:hypothetical protein
MKLPKVVRSYNHADNTAQPKVELTRVGGRSFTFQTDRSHLCSERVRRTHRKPERKDRRTCPERSLSEKSGRGVRADPDDNLGLTEAS